MHDDGFENRLPEELRGIAHELRAERDLPDGHLLERVQKRVLAGVPRKGRSRRLVPRVVVALSVSAVAAVLVSGGMHALPGGLGNGLPSFSLSALVTSSSGQQTSSAANSTYCANGGTSCTCSNPPVGFPNLTGIWSRYSVLALNTSGSQTADFDSGYFTGNVGLAAGSKMIIEKVDKFSGAIYEASGASIQWNGTPSPKPPVGTSSQVTTDRNALIGYSSQLAALKPTVTYPGLSSGVTITGKSGLNVIDINGSLNVSSPVTLSGPKDAFFVVNVTGSINFDGNSSSAFGAGSVRPGGWVSSSNIIVNMTGSGTITSQRYGTGVDGTLLGPKASGGSELAGQWNAFYIGGSFEFQSYPSIKGESCGCGW